MSRLFAVLGFFAVLISLAELLPATANADDAANVATYRKLIDAINKGDVAGALTLFTDNAQLTSPPTCAPSPCNGRAAIQNQLQTEVSIHLQLQLLSTVNVVNGNVTALVAQRADPIRGLGFSRVVVADTVTFTGDRISKFVAERQASDPQTAAFISASSAPAAAPAPATAAAPVGAIPAVAITPPSTGDGGLLSISDRRTSLLPLMVLMGILAVSGVAMRRARTG